MKKAVTSFVAALIVGLPLAALAEMPPAGTTVTKDNLDKYKESLTATQQYFVRNGMTVPVIEYRKYEWPPKYKEATEKYSSQVKLTPDGRDMLNYVAGAPFPAHRRERPAGGREMDVEPRAEDRSTPTTSAVGWNVELVNDRGERERFFGSNFWRRMMWRGRIVLDPKPVVPHDPAVGYYRAVGAAARPERPEGLGRAQFPLRLARRARRLLPLSPGAAEGPPAVDGEPLRRVLGHRHRHRLDLDVELEALVLDLQVPRHAQASSRAFHSGGYAQREALCAQPDGTCGIKVLLLLRERTSCATR